MKTILESLVSGAPTFFIDTIGICRGTIYAVRANLVQSTFEVESIDWQDIPKAERKKHMVCERNLVNNPVAFTQEFRYKDLTVKELVYVCNDKGWVEDAVKRTEYISVRQNLKHREHEVEYIGMFVHFKDGNAVKWPE